MAFVAAPLARLANAVATWVAVAPLTPAVKVRPPTVTDWPAVNALRVTAAVSVEVAAAVTGADCVTVTAVVAAPPVTETAL